MQSVMFSVLVRYAKQLSSKSSHLGTEAIILMFTLGLIRDHLPLIISPLKQIQDFYEGSV